jgi:hypothetical protein
MSSSPADKYKSPFSNFSSSCFNGRSGHRERYCSVHLLDLKIGLAVDVISKGKQQKSWPSMPFGKAYCDTG